MLWACEILSEDPCPGGHMDLRAPPGQECGWDSPCHAPAAQC